MQPSHICMVLENTDEGIPLQPDCILAGLTERMFVSMCCRLRPNAGGAAHGWPTFGPHPYVYSQQ